VDCGSVGAHTLYLHTKSIIIIGILM